MNLVSKESYGGHVTEFYVEVTTESQRNNLRQFAAHHALGRRLTAEELLILQEWRQKRPELAVQELKPDLSFSFRAHFSALSVTESYRGSGKTEAWIAFSLYANEAKLDKYIH